MPVRRAIVAWVGLGVIVLVMATFALLGFSEEGVRSLVRSTARGAVVLFAAAFSASSLAMLAPGPATRWLRANRRYLGISFALVHGVHLLALVVLAVAFPEPFVSELNAVTLIGGGLAYAFVFGMAATSHDRAVAWLGPRRWSRLHTVGGWYIWLIFAQSYGGRVAEGQGLYVPFVLLLVAVVALRVVRRSRLRRRQVASALA